METLKILNSHKLTSSFLGNNQRMFYSIKAMILKKYGTFIEYHLQEYEKKKPRKKGFGCDCDLDEQEACTFSDCVGEYTTQHKNILALYEFEGNTYHLPVEQGFYFVGIVHNFEGTDFMKLLPLCKKTIGLKGDMPELENQKEVILQFCKEVLLFLRDKKATMRDLPSDYQFVTNCYELLEFNNLITDEMQVFYLRFLGKSTKNV